MNFLANFDILYLLKSSNIKYDGLNINEINTLLYISKLMSIYDGKKASDWGYEFSTNAFGGPYSFDIAQELSNLTHKSFIIKKEDCFFFEDKLIYELSKLNIFKNRVKYIDIAIKILMLNPLPALCLAIQNEFNVMKNISLKKNEILTIRNDDDTYKLFEMIRGIYLDKNPQLILPAMAWIKVLITLHDELR